MYGIRGEHQLTEVILDHLSGYKNSKPVRIGNDAYHQKQNDSFGYLMDLIYQYYRLMPGTLDEIEDMWEMVKTILAKVVENWRKPDKGNLGDPGRRTTLCFFQSDVLGSFRSRAKIAQMLNKYNYSERWQLEAEK